MLKKTKIICTIGPSSEKEDVIEELMKARVREARLKKGYRVKGDGADKEFFLLDSKNTK